ncbi:MAG: ABC transporter substrate-binding protein [Chloroflexia bacterium]|nr:ABC transporter substrate-binding protein [Chloroflexia bacterium]
MNRKLDRRQFVTISAAAAGGALIAIRGADAASQTGGAAKEAPELADQVTAGQLPAVAERLPKTPLVLEPEQVGTYGGDWLHFLLPAGAADYINTTIGYEHLVRWRQGATNLTTDEVIPNVAERVDTNPDGSEFTFHLRDGMKWSDGQPFTADDIVFWYKDVLLNKELSPAVPEWLIAGEQPVVVEKRDTLSVVFRFAAPSGLFLVNMATQRGGGPTNSPAHYLKQFHKTYTPQVEQQAKDAQLDDWMAFFNGKADAWENPERPVLHAWVLTGALGAEAQQLVAVRNPYYWKVDPDGNQLPYMNRSVYGRVENEEVALLKALNGEIDMVAREVNELRNKPVFFDNQEKGNFHFFDTTPQQMNQMVLMLNLTHTDANKQRVFSTKDFRVGLSHAMNRQEIIDVIYVSQGQPWQAAPRPESAFYHERLATQYTEYNVELANQHLDKVLPEKDGSGKRLGPDGQPFFFQVEISSLDPDYANVLELIKQHWAAVGIEIAHKVEDQDLFATRTAGNQHDACVSRGGGGLGVLMDPFYYFPYNFNARYAVPWLNWFQNPEGQGAAEPPEIVRQEIEIFREIQTTIDPAQQINLMRQILDIAADQFWCMGVALRANEYGTVKNTLMNTPRNSVTGWLHADLAPTNPPQYFKTG